MAAAVQPSDWLRGQVLFLPHVPGRGVHGVETVFPEGSLKQVCCFHPVSLPTEEIGTE